MSFIKKIQPIEILDKTATTLSSYIINYDGSNCIIYWWLSDETDTKIIDGNYTVPKEIINSWGIDDSIIIETLATSKDFVILH